ncbi:hypothetical protein C4D60_Mb07t19110 [Musa balbisiana]|uniref:Uncharacterized protein n=1 Tax=Musa balbisiana TaxID=52838 RepID=A0A4S8JGD5_MUSBA|nr:hypothetical protein C4D60_Mb07t19110 [Musa balbisiana]
MLRRRRPSPPSSACRCRRSQRKLSIHSSLRQTAGELMRVNLGQRGSRPDDRVFLPGQKSDHHIVSFELLVPRDHDLPHAEGIDSL